MVRKAGYSVFILILLHSSFSLGNVIFVDNQLTEDCIVTYSIANRDNSGSDGNAYNTRSCNSCCCRRYCVDPWRIHKRRVRKTTKTGLKFITLGISDKEFV